MHINMCIITYIRTQVHDCVACGSVPYALVLLMYLSATEWLLPGMPSVLSLPALVQTDIDADQ